MSTLVKIVLAAVMNILSPENVEIHDTSAITPTEKVIKQYAQKQHIDTKLFCYNQES